MARLDRLTLSAVRTDGAILPPGLLKRIHSEDPGLPGLKADDYGLSGERIREAASRAWNALQAPWRAFQIERARLAPTAEGTGMTRRLWLNQILKALDYGALDPIKGSLTVGDREFPISHFYGHAPLHLIGCSLDLDKKSSTPATNHEPRATKISPHGLVQLFLNASDASLWGMVSNGLRWRILRDSVSLSRQALVEFDLEMIFEGQLYDEFLLFYLLCHQSRLKSEKPEGCWLEQWSQAAGEEGKRALETLCGGVQRAIEALGQGALRHPANAGLRDRVRTGDLDKQDYYRQLLRLVYRLLFLFVAEDRGLLLHPQAADDARSLYHDAYSSQRLRLLAERLRGSARHSDLYTVLKLICRKLGEPEGCPELGLAALGGFLFSAAATPDLDAAEIANADLLDAIRCLAVTQEGGRRARVDYRNLGSVELGSVYEALLELEPDLASDGSRFALRSIIGSERKTTGSYYTPEILVECLLDTALDPVLDEALKRPDPERALLALKVCDPACGSGHFLIAAALRIVKRLATVRAGEEEPSPEITRSALRDVIGRCLYGVDKNQMAVELCKVALWMEALEPGKPLSFMDHHIRYGNSLLGATPELITAGLPDDAFTPIEGDDNKACAILRNRNRAEREGWGALFAHEEAEIQARLAEVAAGLEELPDDRPDEIRTKELAFRRHEETEEYRHKKQLADAWCAAFVIWKRFRDPGRILSVSGITQQHLYDLASNRPLSTDLTEEIEQLCSHYQFFHWHLAFPEVFARGGFHVVLGNPPWERVKLQELEYFASTPDIAEAQNATVRKKLIAALPISNPDLWEKWSAASRKAQGESHFARSSGRFPLCGKGDVNTYSLFAEHNWQIMSQQGSAGFIVPSGIATDDTTKDYFHAITKSGALRSLWEFENVGFFTAGKGHMLRFALTTLSGRSDMNNGADFMFQGQAVADLDDPERHFTLSAKDIETINPNTGTCPIFRTRRDASLALTMYRKTGVLWRENDTNGNPWGLRFMAMFHMANDSGLFRTHKELAAAGWELNGNRFEKSGSVMLPLYEAKMVYLYNHRSGTYELEKNEERTHRLPSPEAAQLADPRYMSLPFYWVAESDVNLKLDGVWNHGWLLGWRDITDARASVRTVVASIIPRAGAGDTFLLAMPSLDTRIVACLYANLCSFPFDYAARQKVGGLHLKYHVFRQLPAILPETYMEAVAWDDCLSIRDWLMPRVLELTYTAWDLKPFAEDCGDVGPPFIWDTERRFQLQCEIDAAFFHLYGLSQDDAGYILDTFPVVMRNESQYGEFRTKRVILEIFDAFARAAATGRPYISPLPSPRRTY